MRPVDRAALEDLADPAQFSQYMGKPARYHDFLVFFEAEIDQLGWQAVLNKYLFAGDARANDLLDRLVDGRGALFRRARC